MHERLLSPFATLFSPKSNRLIFWELALKHTKILPALRNFLTSFQPLSLEVRRRTGLTDYWKTLGSEDTLLIWFLQSTNPIYSAKDGSDNIHTQELSETR